MRNRRLLFVLLAAGMVLLSAPALRAQDDVPSVPITFGNFENTGSATVGVRVEDVQGYQPMFLEMFDLTKGFRLQDFSWFGTAKPGTGSFADEYSLTLSGLGDPFETAQLTVTKSQIYDLRVNYRDSNYYWNQNDDVVLPIHMLAPALSTGLTNNHDWNTTRRLGSVDFTIHATKALRFNFDYYRDTNDGTLDTTRAPSFFDDPGFWGTFARGNPYFLLAPLHDATNRFAGGVDYTYRTWSFHYKIGYQTYTELTNLNNVSSPELSIDPAASSLTTPLTSFSENTDRSLTTPVSEFSYVGQPFANFDLRGGYSFYRYTGPANLNESFDGIAPNSMGVNAPYTVSQALGATVTEPNNIVSQGLTYHIRPWWDLDVDYRYTRFSTDTNGVYSSIFNGGAPSTGTVNEVWRDGISDLDVTMGFTPFKSLIIRPGVTLMKADVEELENGVADPAQTLRTKTVWPEVSFGYNPSKMFSIRGSYHAFTNSAAYTATTPHTEEGTHLIARFQPIAKVSIENDVNIVSDKLIDANYISNVRDEAITLSYTYSQHWSVFTGFTYGSFFAQGNIAYARGTAPLMEVLRDQEVNRVWEGGAEGKFKRFGMRLTMNYVHSSGVGQIGNEPPAYGPLTWPLGTAAIYYDFPKAGRLTFDLQRTYYKEYIVPVNNFSANMLMILWTRNW